MTASDRHSPPGIARMWYGSAYPPTGVNSRLRSQLAAGAPELTGRIALEALFALRFRGLRFHDPFHGQLLRLTVLRLGRHRAFEGNHAEHLREHRAHPDLLADGFGSSARGSHLLSTDSARTTVPRQVPATAPAPDPVRPGTARRILPPTSAATPGGLASSPGHPRLGDPRSIRRAERLTATGAAMVG